MQEHMKRLISKADIITPNFTEACFLLGELYTDQVVKTDLIKNWLIRLADFGPSVVIMTGIPVEGNQIMNIGYEKSTGSFWQVLSEHIPAKYPGTGDVFASILAGALLSQYSVAAAMQLAADFVAMAIKATYEAGTPAREGVMLEKGLPWLAQMWAKLSVNK